MTRTLRRGLVSAASAAALTAFGLASLAAAQPPAPPYLNNFPDFAPQLTPQQLPGDVDMALKQSLDDQKKFSLVQRLFDLWSWQAFISLNWPTDANGNRIVGTSGESEPPAWTLWTTARASSCRTGRSRPYAGRALRSRLRRPIASRDSRLSPRRIGPSIFPRASTRKTRAALSKSSSRGKSSRRALTIPIVTSPKRL